MSKQMRLIDTVIMCFLEDWKKENRAASEISTIPTLRSGWWPSNQHVLLFWIWPTCILLLNNRPFCIISHFVLMWLLKSVTVSFVQPCTMWFHPTAPGPSVHAKRLHEVILCASADCLHLVTGGVTKMASVTGSKSMRACSTGRWYILSGSGAEV